jgi:hypothetical protein
VSLNYENLKLYNSQLPLPKFEGISQGSGLHQDQFATPSVPSHEEHKNEPVQSQDQNMDDEEDDFDAFVEAEQQPPAQKEDQPPQQPVKQLTEEEKRKLEEEERLKRLDLISSVFDDALFEEPAENAPKPEDKKTEVAEHKKHEDIKIEQPNETTSQPTAIQSSGWASFAFPPSQESQLPVHKEQTWSTAPSGWGIPSIDKAESVKRKESDDFDDFVEADQPSSNVPEQKSTILEVQNNPTKLTKDQTSKEEVFSSAFPSILTKKSSTEGDFPSLFDGSSTPRIDTEDKSDIRMSFPSQEMWSSNFGKEQKEGNSGWTTGGFGFSDIEHPIIKEKDEDEFKDIMAMKEGKQRKKSDSFEGFTEPQKSNEQSKMEHEEIKKKTEESQKKGGLKPPKSAGFKAPDKNDAWGKFEFEEGKKEDKHESSSWANFSEPATVLPKKEDSSVSKKSDDKGIV